MKEFLLFIRKFCPICAEWRQAIRMKGYPRVTIIDIDSEDSRLKILKGFFGEMEEWKLPTLVVREKEGSRWINSFIVISGLDHEYDMFLLEKLMEV